jgi:hypothetical protein
MIERPRLTITEAASAAGKHRNSIRRRLDAGQFPNAQKNPSGVVEIPVEDLLASGLELNRPAPPAPDVQPPETPEPAEVDTLRERLREAEHRAELAEALAGERERALEDLRVALRALGPGEPQTPAPLAPTGAPQAPRGRWPWARTR